MAKPKHLVSIGSNGEELPEGRLFIDPGTAETFDLSGVRVVSFQTDTVRQLYHGKLNREALEVMESRGMVSMGGYYWHAGRIGRDSGYQFKLQNADLGVILLFKSFHAPEDCEGNHLKIELSPHFIQAHTEQELQFKTDCFADLILSEGWNYQGVAVHVACDVQGWRPPEDFESRIHCRSRRVRAFHGVEEVEFSAMSARYGRGESFLFGSASGQQLAVYNKTDEAKAHDKLDYWRNVWERSGQYNPQQDVYRIELRFHHSVINQFSRGTVETTTGCQFDMGSYKEVYSHLTGLWRYGLDSFKFLHRPGYFAPVWTVLTRLEVAEIPEDVQYKRGYKQADTFSGKNIELLLGNFLSCAARHQMTKRNTWEAIKKMPFFPIIRDYYEDKGKGEKDLRDHLYKLHDERIVRYGRAV